MRIPKPRKHSSGRVFLECKLLFPNPPHRHYYGWQGTPEADQEYQRLVALYLEKKRKASSRVPLRSKTDAVTVGQLVARFLEWARDRYGSGRTEHSNLKHGLRPLTKKAATVLVEDFGPLALKEVRKSMVEDFGWCRQNVNARVNKIRRCIKWGVENELVDPQILAALQSVSPLRAGEPGVRECPKRRPVEWPRVREVLPFLPRTVRLMVRIQWLTGMRSCELVRMSWPEIDRTGDVWLYAPSRHKTAHRGIEKIICLGPRVQAFLSPFLDADGPLFRSHRGGHFDSQYYRVSILVGFERLLESRGYTSRTEPSPPSIDWMRSVGFEPWFPHLLRHSRATVTRAKYGIEGAQATTGNTLRSTEIYAKRSLDLAKRIARETG